LASNRNTLIGYAVLRANYDANAPSYLDNFQRFGLDVLANYRPTPTSPHDVAQAIEVRFGLTIPDLVVTNILGRSLSAKLVEGNSKDGFFITERGLKKIPDVGNQADTFRRKQAELVEKFRGYATELHSEHVGLLEADLAEKLVNYFEVHAVPILAQSIRGEAPPVRQTETGYDFLFSSFVTHLAAQDAVGFGYVEDAAKGAILAAVVLLDTSTLQRSLKGLTLYLDTPVLINVLGYHGAASQTAAEQMLRLAQKLGASVAAFDHSIKELEGVLSSAETSLRIRGGRGGPTNLVFAHFISENVSAADVAMHRAGITKNLNAAHIEIKPLPSGYHRYGLDETQLEIELGSLIRYQHDRARRYDVDSLSAIHRLRKGEDSSNIERTRAIFITTNAAVARASSNFAGETKSWPLAMTESAIASMLWVRSPAIADDLPRAQLLASAFAGMQPAKPLWGKYLDEVAKLEIRGELSPEDALLLRIGIEPRMALMAETLGEAAEISSDTLLSVLDRMKQETVKPFLEELSAERGRTSKATQEADNASTGWLAQQEVNSDLLKKVEAAEEKATYMLQKVSELEDRDALRMDRIRHRAIKMAKITVLIVTSALGLPIIVLSFLSFVLPNTNDVPTWLKTSGAVAGAFLLTIAAVREFVPGTVSGWLKKIEQPLAKKYEVASIRRAGLGE
jgi:hypothetical protein